MKKIALILSLAAFVNSCTTPSKLLEEANTNFENLEYHKAATHYSEYLSMKEDEKAGIKLAQCYYHMNHFSEAEKYYKKIIGVREIPPVVELEYAHVLKHNGNYSEAVKWYTKYLSYNPSNEAVRNEMISCDSLENYKRESYKYTVTESKFNDTSSNFGPVFYKNGLVFCSDRSKPHHGEISEWTGHTFLDMYFLDLTKENATPELFSPALTSKYNDGPACFSKDGNTIYFTRNMMKKKNHLEKNRNLENNLEIYSSKFKNGEWTAPQLLSFDNIEYSVGHPALSSDGNRLYFVSDMPGGFGGTDIYFAQKDPVTGGWAAPINAGAKINTNENEMFPTVFMENDSVECLYFSSEGKQGMGGLDIYQSVVIKENTLCCPEQKPGSLSSFSNSKKEYFAEPKHLTAPLNSAADDFEMTIAPDGVHGYFSSNRDSKEGVDKVYAFTKYVPEFFLEVTVVQKGSLQPIGGTTVEMLEKNQNKKETAYTDNLGKIIMKIPQNSDFDFTVLKDNFFTGMGQANNNGKIFSDTIRINFELDAIVINKPIRLDNIYYDYNKWDIRSDAAFELEKLVKILTENPGIQIELSSHTDARGSDKYNLTLSQKRAQSAVDYIIGRGINSSRVYAKGYGESKILNHCSNGAKCTDDEHQLNRRTEFAVIKILNVEKDLSTRK
jgi:peptidoglycan-associated lipoprotein